MSVIYICGGPGTGKTTLISSYIREKSIKDIAWLSLDESNSNLYSFWLYFIAALNQFLRNGENLLSLMRSNMDIANIENLLIMLINSLDSEDEYYLVLDDIHSIKDRKLINSIEFFIQNMPVNLHIIMLSREEPAIYLGPVSMSGRLLFIDSQEMEIEEGEGISFLKETLAMALKEDHMKTLLNYSEGWIGGLQLIAAASSGNIDPGGLLTSDGRIATQYLTREIFDSLSKREQDFLIKTGFLSYFNQDICCYIMPDLDNLEFSRIIDGFIRKNLFIICIDEDRKAYRNHNILTDYLIKCLEEYPKEEKSKFYIRAGAAFEIIGDIEEAMKEYSRAEDYENMIRIGKASQGKIEMFSYLDKIPVERLVSDLDVSIQSFMYGLASLNIGRASEIFRKVKEEHGDSDIFRCIQFAEPLISSDEAIVPKYSPLTASQIDRLPFNQMIKAYILVGNSIALLGSLQYEEAITCLERAMEAYGASNILIKYFSYIQMAQIYEELGRLNDSLSSYDKAKRYLESSLLAPGTGSNFYIGITGVHMLRMDLDSAMEALEKAEEIVRDKYRHWITNLNLAGHYAEIEFLRGNFEEGVLLVKKILDEYPEVNPLVLERLIMKMEYMEVLPEDMARNFLGQIEAEEEYKLQPSLRILSARLLFSLGQWEKGLNEVEEILVFSRIHKNKLRLVEAALLKIHMLAKDMEDEATARTIDNLLRESIHYAHKDRIILPFFLNLKLLGPLLQGLLEGKIRNKLVKREEEFAKELIDMIYKRSKDTKEEDILTPRELEVLVELSKGIRNKEIGERLCISQSIVKTHVINIYSKLKVSSRLMAVEERRKKGLI